LGVTHDRAPVSLKTGVDVDHKGVLRGSRPGWTGAASGEGPLVEVTVVV
jgi:hypothetical protein